MCKCSELKQLHNEPIAVFFEYIYENNIELVGTDKEKNFWFKCSNCEKLTKL